jgi:hypothetical protein
MITGQENEPLLSAEDEVGLKLIEGSSVHLVGSKTGLNLLSTLNHNHGVDGYGYNDDFFILYSPGTFKYTYPFFDADIEIERSLLNGSSYGEAFDDAIWKYQQVIETAPDVCKPFLYHNMKALTFVGDDKKVMADKDTIFNFVSFAVRFLERLLWQLKLK